MPDDEQIIRGCCKKDKKAQKMLYNKYASTMLGICMRYAQNRSEAEDILQEGFVKIFLNINQYLGKGSFEGWMRQIMVNTALTNYRNNLKHYYHNDVTEIAESRIDDDVSYDGEFTQEELLKIINDLPEGYRVVFNLYAVEGYKHKEIAEMLSIDESTSKSQFSRGKKLIQQKLEELKKERAHY